MGKKEDLRAGLLNNNLASVTLTLSDLEVVLQRLVGDAKD